MAIVYKSHSKSLKRWQQSTRANQRGWSDWNSLKDTYKEVDMAIVYKSHQRGWSDGNSLQEPCKEVDVMEIIVVQWFVPSKLFLGSPIPPVSFYGS